MTDKELRKIYSAYFPYDLEMAYCDKHGDILRTGILKTIDYNESDTHPMRMTIEGLYDMEHEWMFKPFLRSMLDFKRYFSDLFETDIDVRTFLSEESIEEDTGFESINHMLESKHEWWSYGAVQLALKHKFNIFDLPKDKYIAYESR